MTIVSSGPYAPALPRRILRSLWISYPSPLLSGQICLESLHNLGDVLRALDDMVVAGMIHRLTTAEKVEMRIRKDCDFYSLTDFGYRSYKEE